MKSLNLVENKSLIHYILLHQIVKKVVRTNQPIDHCTSL